MYKVFEFEKKNQTWKILYFKALNLTKQPSKKYILTQLIYVKKATSDMRRSP